jgi:hypothetical protein
MKEIKPESHEPCECGCGFKELFIRSLRLFKERRLLNACEKEIRLCEKYNKKYIFHRKKNVARESRYREKCEIHRKKAERLLIECHDCFGDEEE